MLEGSHFDLHSVDAEGVVFDLVRRTRFDLILISTESPGANTQFLLDAIRGEGSASQQASVLLLSPPDEFLKTGRFVDRGANRVAGVDWSNGRIWQAMADLLAIAPRVWVRTLVELEVECGVGTQRDLYRTENISTTGMLLQDASNLAPGNRFSFLFALPDRGQAVHGVAEVVRRTDPERGEVAGIGARFLSFRDNDESQLNAFIQRRLTITDNIVAPA
ncbi:MAG: hypothetical protein GY906_31030 [bacterium]|nr:hypothetical protein [bacterium]